MSHSIPQRDLRNKISSILKEVNEGESFEVTVRGKPVAELIPIRKRPTFIGRDRFVEMFTAAPLDRDFLSDVDEVLGETIDEL